MAYLRIPFIAAGHNPHISFAISHTTHNQGEYREMILNYKTLSGSAESLQYETLKVYCTRNLAVMADDVGLQDVTHRFCALMADWGEWLYDAGDFCSFVERIAAQAAPKGASEELAAHLNADPECKSMPNAVTHYCDQVGVLQR